MDRNVNLDNLVREALFQGLMDLSSVTRHVLLQLDESERYRAVGRIAAIIARLRTPRSKRERPWIAVAPSLEIEDWAIEPDEEIKAK